VTTCFVEDVCRLASHRHTPQCSLHFMPFVPLTVSNNSNIIENRLILDEGKAYKNGAIFWATL